MDKRYFSTKKDFSRREHKRYVYKAVKWLLCHTFFKRMRVERSYPDEGPEPVLYIANHSGAFGPISMVCFFDRRVRPWVISDVCYMRTFPAFARKDFFHPKNPFSKAFFWVASYVLAPLGSWVFTNVEAIPAHFSGKVVQSIDKSIETLEEGISVLIFPEKRQYFSPYVEEFQDGFAYVASRYYKKTGRRIKVVPVYCCHADGYIHVGRSTVYEPDRPFVQEKQRLAEYARDEIDAMARKFGGDVEYVPENYSQGDAPEEEC